MIINEVLKQYQPNKHKILYLTENNILNTRLHMSISILYLIQTKTKN